MLYPHDRVTDRWAVMGEHGHRQESPVPFLEGPTVGLLSCLPFSTLVLHNITRGIFETIVEQAPLAIEDLMNEMEGEVSEEDEQEQDMPAKKRFERPPKGEGPVFNMVCLHLCATRPAPRQ